MAIFTRTDQADVRRPSPPWTPEPDGGGRRPGPAAGRGGGARRAARGLGRHWAWVLAACVAVAGTLVGTEVAGGASTYPLGADFARAPGLFPGAAVEVLGVPVGRVTAVRPVGDEVKVQLAIDRGRAIPAAATAALVSPQLLGEPSIELSPGYTGGPSLRAGAVIPMSRTAVPVSTAQMLKALDRTLRRIDPKAVGGLVTNLAQDLNGQGKNLNTLIAGAAGTLRLLATKADDLGQLSGSLAQLTGTLDARTAQITQLITDYDTVSGVIATHSSQLGGAVVQLSEASTQLVHVLVPNLSPIEKDVGTVTTVGRTLDRNLTSIDGLLAASTSLFTGARRAYTPTYNWITLNSQNPTGLTGAIIATQVRHRLEGVCRRILAHRAEGLSPAQKKALETCGNPRSSYFDPIVSQIPTVLRDVRAGKLPQSASPAQLFQQGLATIPGAGASAKPASGQPSSSPAPGSPPPGSTGTPTGTPTRGSGTGGTGSTGGSGSTPSTCLTNLLGLLTCPAPTASPASSGASSGTRSAPTAGTGGSGGLVAYDVPGASGAPSLSAASGRYLPPLPGSAPGARHRLHRLHLRHPRARTVRSRTGAGPRFRTAGMR